MSHRVVYQFDDVQALSRYAITNSNDLCACSIIYNGVVVFVGIFTAAEWLQKLSFSPKIDVDSMHDSFHSLWFLFRKSKLASSSLVVGHCKAYQDKLIPTLLPTIREFLPDIETVQDAVDYFFKYAYSMIFVEKAQHIRRNANWNDSYFFIGLANVVPEDFEEDTNAPSPFRCANIGCFNVGVKVCAHCKIQKYCSDSCHVQHWRINHKRECLDAMQFSVLTCGNKGCQGKALHNCSRCLSVKYCSRDCQVYDWKKGHKRRCCN